MTEIEMLRHRTEALEARVLYLESLINQALQPLSPPFTHLRLFGSTATDGLGNRHSTSGFVYGPTAEVVL